MELQPEALHCSSSIKVSGAHTHTQRYVGLGGGGGAAGTIKPTPPPPMKKRQY